MLSIEFIQSIDWPKWGFPRRMRPNMKARRRFRVNPKEYTC
jgi:hypothetical protein